MHYYTYDAENRLTQVDSGTTAAYLYDGSGKRVAKTTGGTTVDYLYDLAGHVVTELNSTGTWNRVEVFAGNTHVATYSGGPTGVTYFAHSDWLGTERARTTIAGTIYENCTSLPFGDNLQCSSGDISPSHFTGKERDSESNLDNFQARYSGSNLGRFMSPDPSSTGGDSVEAESPQSWNMYSYVLNNPLDAIDPDGLDCIYTGEQSASSVSVLVVRGDSRRRLSRLKELHFRNNKLISAPLSIGMLLFELEHWFSKADTTMK
jgi:RHS repeat-associated protein